MKRRTYQTRDGGTVTELIPETEADKRLLEKRQDHPGLDTLSDIKEYARENDLPVPDAKEVEGEPATEKDLELGLT